MHFSGCDSDVRADFLSTAYKLLFITDKNTSLMVVAILKNCFVSANLLYQIMLFVLFVSIKISMEITRKHYFQNSLYMY